MGETLAETRVEVEAQRVELQRTADELRGALDLRARFRENPALFIGLGAGALFLVAGGPTRIARLLRRRLRPNAAEQAFDALPKPMQAWVDAVASDLGPRAGKARDAMVEEIQHWRRDQVKSKKARRELARAVVDGPPGASRTAWKAAETALTLVSAALARRAIERFLSGASSQAADATPESAPLGARKYSGFSTVAPSDADRS